MCLFTVFYCLLPSVLSANVHSKVLCIMALLCCSPQVCLKVWRRWSVPESGALLSWAAISPLLPKEPPPQTSSLCMWWSGCASVTVFPSSSNLEFMLHGCIQTTRVRTTHMRSFTHAFPKLMKDLDRGLYGRSMGQKNICQILVSAASYCFPAPCKNTC